MAPTMAEECDLERNSKLTTAPTMKRTVSDVVTERTGDLNDTEPTNGKSLSFKLAFIGLASSLFVFQLDATCLGIALPTIASDLKGSSLESFWASLAYTLCGLVMQPIWASVSGTFGRKQPLFVSMTFFFAGSIAFAVAQNMNTIIIGRVLQGFGGGGIDVLVEVIVADMTTLEERSKYLGLIAIPNAVGNIMGPTVGALFSNYASWRWIGWINLPFLGVGATLLYFFLNLRSVTIDKSLTAKLDRLDWIGMILVVTGLTIFVLPLSWAGSLFPWASWQTLVPMLLGAAVLVVFVIYEAKPEEPVVPHRLFSSKTGNMTLIGGFLHGAVMFSLLQYLPLFYQAVSLKTAIASAVSLLPTSIVSVTAAVCSMMLVPWFGGYTWLVRLSWIFLTLGTGLLILFEVNGSNSMYLGLPVIWGVGIAMLRLNILPIQASVKNVDDTGLAIANFMTIRMVGGLVGLTISSAIFNTVFATERSSSGVSLEGPLAPLNDAANAVSFIETLRLLGGTVTDLDQVLRVYLECFRTIFYTMTGLAGLGLITSFFIDEIDLKGQGLGSQRFEE